MKMMEIGDEAPLRACPQSPARVPPPGRLRGRHEEAPDARVLPGASFDGLRSGRRRALQACGPARARGFRGRGALARGVRRAPGVPEPARAGRDQGAPRLRPERNRKGSDLGHRGQQGRPGPPQVRGKARNRQRRGLRPRFHLLRGPRHRWRVRQHAGTRDLRGRDHGREPAGPCRNRLRRGVGRSWGRLRCQGDLGRVPERGRDHRGDHLR